MGTFYRSRAEKNFFAVKSSKSVSHGVKPKLSFFDVKNSLKQFATNAKPFFICQSVRLFCHCFHHHFITCSLSLTLFSLSVCLSYAMHYIKSALLSAELKINHYHSVYMCECAREMENYKQEAIEKEMYMYVDWKRAKKSFTHQILEW